MDCSTRFMVYDVPELGYEMSQIIPGNNLESDLDSVSAFAFVFVGVGTSVFTNVASCCWSSWLCRNPMLIMAKITIAANKNRSPDPDIGKFILIADT